ncbi:TPA: YqcI/YcgG family protein [Escherichia coli]|nr:YqcI/YcgG family protein [Escherichia coli]HEA6318482.1 YqcI/YcgG family protein [Escherichia coli]HEA6337691.1 YqcI/YcgG family protein [Escherichia coli]HEA6390071.1 YqcI/YcgG family protein [Escherichia coli]
MNGNIVLLTQEYIEKSISNAALDEWIINAYRDISNIISRKDFPCLFGKHAWKLGSVLFAFIQNNDIEHQLVNALIELTNRVKNLPQEDRIYSPLLCVFENSNFSSLVEEHNFSWEVLQKLHNNDIAEWPKHIPVNPDSSEWSFCFNGVELFINISCPNHTKIKSRNLGNNIVFVINPRIHFDIVANLNDSKGIKIRKVIRERSTKYNEGIRSMDLGFYGDQDNREWKQYALHEPGTPIVENCPLNIKGK